MTAGRVLGTRGAVAALAVFVAVLLLLAGQGRADQTFAGVLVAYALLAVSLDLVWGFAGILSLGHALYFGVGAYATALLATRLQIDDVLPLLVASGLGGGITAALVGALLFLGRRQFPLIFVAMTTLAASYVAETLASSWSAIGSDTGIPGVRPGTLAGLELGGGRGRFLLSLVLVTLVAVGLHRLLHSELGLVLAGLRDAEGFLQAAGFRTGHHKVVLFGLSGVTAGLAGSLYVANVGFVSPGAVGFQLSTLAVIWVLAGGLGHLFGAMYGAVLVEYATRYFTRAFVGWWEIVVGLLLLLVVLFFPGGLFGLRLGIARLRRARRPVDTGGGDDAA